MHDFGGIFIVVLSTMLVLAVGWVLFNVGRIVICIYRDARSEGQPPRQLQHPEFGTLTFEGKLWSGKIQRGGKVISFTVAGMASGPDAMLIERLRATAARLPELEREALAFLRGQAPAVCQGEFTFESLDFLWEERPDAFVLEFSLAGDDDGIWRVEFEAGRPQHVGRDD